MNLTNEIKNKIGPCTDYIFKDIVIKNTKVNLIFNEVLCSGSDINDFILRTFSKT